MKKALNFLLYPIIYGLALAFVILILWPSISGGQQFQPSFSTQPAPASYRTAVHRAAPAVVNIYSQSITTTPRFMRSVPEKREELGSGVLMTKDGYILTNYHVVNQADQIEVVLQDGRIMQGELVGKDLITDLALLKVPATDLPTIPQDDNLDPQVGDVVLALGNPLNLGLTVTHGIISATKKRFVDNSYVTFLQMDAAINAGNSGGPLVNSEGYLVGISTSSFQTMYENVQGIFFAIPYHIAKRITEQLARYGRIVRGYFGARGHPVNEAGQATLSSVDPVKGIMLDNIEPLGPAYKAGLLPGDIITHVNGQPVKSVARSLFTIETTPPGKQLSITVERQTQIIQVSVLIEELRVN